ncbi:MAG: hypothetical protein LBB85_07475 [Dysgonamonadaceae bacterium]|jgi:hypothetical protein|nr:hypothetical protein [Dysgonamonadaceae bacterium]
MYQSLLYKEWIKTRSAVLIIAAVFLGAGIYSFLKLNEGIRLSGIVMVWENTVQKDPLFFPYFEYLPLLAGILLAITQYIPELQFKRLKLTLHLPLKESNILLTMLLYGIGILVLLTLITVPLLLWGLGRQFPAEMVCAGFQQLLPWFLACPVAYLITAWVCLEPQWKQRILNVLPGILFLSLFLLRTRSGAYQPFDPYLIVALIASFFFPFYSTTRFKEGVQ